jgi:cysteine-rich repeat protein
MQDPVEEGVEGCIEICGDGFNYGSYECDDGNLLDKDGCNSKC